MSQRPHPHIDGRSPEVRALASLEGLEGRVRALAAAFVQSGLVRLRVARGADDAIEFRRRAPSAAPRVPEAAVFSANGAPERLYDVIHADLVGIARFSRPAPAAGLALESDRELASVEALGIRTPVRSLGPGRIVSVLFDDGAPVEYGQPLFEIDRE